MNGAASPGSATAKTLVLVGCGQMGAAMLRGWLQSVPQLPTYIVDRAGWAPLPPELVPPPSEVVSNSRGHSCPNWRASWCRTRSSFAVKPQVFDEIVPSYRRFAGPRTVFLSIAAGKTIAGLARHLGDAAIVAPHAQARRPPSCRAISVACATPRVSAAQRQLCEGLLAAIGDSTWIADEALMDAVTAVSGSGPAYVFLLIEALAAAGEKSGLPADLALQLATATVAGSGELAAVAKETPARLRENVTSPGGTTRAALDVLMADDGLAPLMERAIAAATRRSRELAS